MWINYFFRFYRSCGHLVSTINKYMPFILLFCSPPISTFNLKGNPVLVLQLILERHECQSRLVEVLYSLGNYQQKQNNFNLKKSFKHTKRKMKYKNTYSRWKRLIKTQPTTFFPRTKVTTN